MHREPAVTAALSEISFIVRDVLSDSQLELTPETRFDELAGWDSMDLVTVVVEVECRLEIIFEPAEVDGLATIGDLLHMIAAKQMPVSA